MDGAQRLSSVKLFFQSSSRIRNKSDSIQPPAGLQHDRKGNDGESFYCDRIAPAEFVNASNAVKISGQKNAVEKYFFVRKFCVKTVAPQARTRPRTAPTRRGEIRAP
jgi:hypothetical protein